MLYHCHQMILQPTHPIQLIIQPTPLKQQRLCYQLLSAAIAWEVFEIAPN